MWNSINAENNCWNFWKFIIKLLKHFLSFACRFVSSDIPSDLQVQIGEANFHLHKVVIFSFVLSSKFFSFLESYFLFSPKDKIYYWPVNQAVNELAIVKDKSFGRIWVWNLTEIIIGYILLTFLLISGLIEPFSPGNRRVKN
jgi:hypothetical protein